MRFKSKLAVAVVVGLGATLGVAIPASAATMEFSSQYECSQARPTTGIVWTSGCYKVHSGTGITTWVRNYEIGKRVGPVIPH